MRWGFAVMPVVVLVLLSGCGEKKEAGSNQDAAGFTVLRNAVEFPSGSDWVVPGQGLRQLLPLGNCVLGVGTYANGQRYVRANWTGDAGCTTLRLDPPARAETAEDQPPDADGWAGDGLGGVALPWDDGVVIAAAGGIARRDAQGDVEFLATIPFDNTDRSADVPDPEAKTTSMTRSGNRILLVGSGSGPATVYASDDAGATVRGVALPQAPDAEHPDQPRLIAADGSSVVATGYGGDWLTTWWSADAGETWTAARLRTGPGQWLVDVVVRAGGGWHALGRVTNPTGPDRPLWLTSVDGTGWTVRDTTAMGEGGIVAATVDKAGALVLVGVRDQTDVASPGTDCGVVWTGPAAGPFNRGEMGCNEFPPLTTATLADGRVLIAGNRDLWVRP